MHNHSVQRILIAAALLAAIGVIWSCSKAGGGTDAGSAVQNRGGNPGGGTSAGPDGGAPAEGEGVPGEGEGAPGEGEGAPTEGEGPPAEGEGPPIEGEGTPTEGEGAATEGEGSTGPTTDQYCDRKCQFIKSCPEIFAGEAACIQQCRTEFGVATPPQALLDQVDCLQNAQNCNAAANCINANPVEGEGVPTEGEGAPVEGEGVPVEGEGTCDPYCVGRQCGPDGCGGRCGDCPPNYNCTQGQCEKQCEGTVAQTNCTYTQNCTKDSECPCAFTCTANGKCLSAHCFCQEQRGDHPCGVGLACDEESGWCIQESEPCTTDAQCQVHGPNWTCENGNCNRGDSSCTDDTECARYAPAIYECLSGMCTGAAEHNEPCPGYKDWECASGHVCINGTCKKMCSTPNSPCPNPPGGQCYQNVIPIFNIPDGPAYCK